MDAIVWNLKHSNLNGTKLAWVANQQRSSQDVRPSNSLNILATHCYSVVSCKLLLLLQLASYCFTSVCTLLSGWESCCQCFCWLPWLQLWQRLEHKRSTVKQQKVSHGCGSKTCKNREISNVRTPSPFCQKDPESGFPAASCNLSLTSRSSQHLWRVINHNQTIVSLKYKD